MDDLTAAQASLATLLAAIPQDGWSRATPCSDWDVAAVVRHLVVGERAFTTSLSGTPYDLAAVTAAVTDVEVAELPSVYAAGALGLQEAVAAADPAAEFPSGLGLVTATDIADLRTLEALVHGWDVSVATGLPLPVDDALAERSVAYARTLRTRVAEPERRFGVPQDLAATAPALDRLAAILGRSR